MFAEVAGLWPLGHPSREKEQMLEQPEFVHLPRHTAAVLLIKRTNLF